MLPEAGVVGATTGRLDVALQQEQQRDSVAEPVAEAGVVVLLPLNLAAHGVDDLVKQHRAVCLEDLPLETAPEDEIGCHWSALMEAQVICTERGQCYVSLCAAWYITRLFAGVNISFRSFCHVSTGRQLSWLINSRLAGSSYICTFFCRPVKQPFAAIVLYPIAATQ